MVREAGYKNQNGYYLTIDHQPAGFDTYYLHLQKDSLLVKPGDAVTQGGVLGLMGNSGHSVGPTGVHLHLGVRWNGGGNKEVRPLADELVLEGRPLRGFQVGAGGNYYQSTNAP